MKVLLTHAYFLNDDEREKKIMKLYPPLGILYISAYLEENGIENEVFDTTFSSKGELKKYILINKPNYLCIYVNLITKLNVLDLIKFVKTNDELSNTKIILGGPDVRYNSLNLLNAGADYIVVGEGEITTYELISKLEGKDSNLSDIKGLNYLNEDNDLINSGEREKIKEIDDLPLANRNKINLNKYLSTWKKYHNKSSITVSTMRGCPYTCKWCSRAVYGLTYRRLSPKRTIEEIKFLLEKYSPDRFWFVDDVFTISHKWLKEFAEQIKKGNMNISYECITRADRMNEDVINLLKKTGCFRVWIGAESGSQKIIDRMDRRVNVKYVREMIELVKQKGIEAGTFIMLGYPGETINDIEATIDHLKLASPDHFTITITYPIKGTDLFKEVENLQIQNYNWASTTDRDIDFKRTYNRKFYDYAIRRVNNEVNYHIKKKTHQLNFELLKIKIKSILSRLGMWWEIRKV